MLAVAPQYSAYVDTIGLTSCGDLCTLMLNYITENVQKLVSIMRKLHIAFNALL